MKLCVSYDFSNVEKGLTQASIDYFVLNGLKVKKSIGKALVLKIEKNTNLYGVFIGEEIECDHDKFIIFKKDIEEPVFISENKYYSPINYSWLIQKTTRNKKTTVNIIGSKKCYEVEVLKKEDKVKKEKIEEIDELVIQNLGEPITKKNITSVVFGNGNDFRKSEDK